MKTEVVQKLKPAGITNPLQTDLLKYCEGDPLHCRGLDTALYIRGGKIIRLCSGCVLEQDSPLNNRPRFVRRHK
jgi:hypothetical protein